VKLSDAKALAGDVNGDNAIGTLDLQAIGAVFGVKRNSSNYDPRADLNDDGVIDILDMTLASTQFGKSGIQLWP
jgi:trimeric autotransporter adhesin